MNFTDMRFKVGDRVSIASLGWYSPEAEQGLLVGNTGTVRTIYEDVGVYGVETDNAKNSLSLDGEGWAFFDHELDPITEDEVRP